MRRLLPGTAAALLALASGSASTRSLQVGELHVRKAMFRIDWAAHARGENRDAFSISGTLNRSGIFGDLTDAVFRLWVDGWPLPPLTLDAAGNAASPPGSSPSSRVQVRGKSGKWFFSAEGLDLTVALRIRNQTGGGTTPVWVVVEIEGAGLRDSESSGQFEFAHATVADEATRGTFAFGSGATLSGLVLPLKARALERHDYAFPTHDLSFSALLVGIDGGPVIPVDSPASLDAILHVGAISFGIRFEDLLVSGSGADSVYKYDTQNGLLAGLSLSIDNRRGRLSFALPVGSEPGLPPAGPGNGTSHVLPVALDLQTAAGPLSIETAVVLQRGSETNLRWRF